MKRYQIDLTDRSAYLDDILNCCQVVGTKLATGVGVRVGGSAKRGNISRYKYINTKKVLLERSLKASIDRFTQSMNLKSNVITHNILHFEPGHFLDWQDYYMWKKNFQLVGSMAIIGPVIKFFSIALTTGNNIEFKDREYDVDKHHGIVFELSDVHRVLPVQMDQYWLVLGVAKHIDIISQINC